MQGFLDDETFGGSWADDDVDLSSISVPVQSAKSAYEPPSFSGLAHPGSGPSDRPVRREFPVPDEAPFKARVSNLPWDVTEEEVGQWFEEKVGQGTFSKLVAPTENGRLKGSAFITFNTRDLLLQALDLSAQELNGRRVFVSVAAPDKSRDDFDWGARRGPLSGGPPQNDRFGGERGERRPRREDADFDWGARKGPLAAGEVNEGEEKPFHARSHERGERGERAERKPRREEPEFDWSARRGPLPGGPEPTEEKAEKKSFDKPRGERTERKPRREEPEFDWTARRGPLPVSEKPARENGKDRSNSGNFRKTNSNKKQESQLDWGSARSASGRFTAAKGAGHAKAQAKEAETKKDAAKPTQSIYHLLENEGDDN